MSKVKKRASSRASSARRKLAATPEPVDFKYVVSHRLRELRETAGISRTTFALVMQEALGFASWTDMTVVNIERGSRAVSLEELLAIAALWEVPALDLLRPTDAPVALPSSELSAADVSELFAGGSPDWRVARRLTGGTVLAQRLREGLEKQTAHEVRVAETSATQFRRLLRHLPEDELPESEPGEPEALAFRTFGGGHLLVRRNEDGAMYTLNPETGGADRIELRGGGSWLTHYRDGEQLGRPEPYVLPPELADLN